MKGAMKNVVFRSRTIYSGNKKKTQKQHELRAKGVLKSYYNFKYAWRMSNEPAKKPRWTISQRGGAEMQQSDPFDIMAAL